MHDSHRWAEKGNGVKRSESVGAFMADPVTLLNHLAQGGGWGGGSQGQSDKTAVCEAGNNLFGSYHNTKQ